MAEPLDGGTSQTLAEYLARLGPGDACPCCGQATLAIPAAGAAGRAISRCGGSREVVELVACPRCRCEVAAVPSAQTTGAMVGLARAA